MMKISDGKLVNQLKKGDRKAFDTLFYRYKNGMLHFCVSLLKDYDEAENIVQESFIKIWEIRERLDPDKGVEAYLYTIIRNKSYDYFKRLEKEYALQAQLRHHTWPIDSVAVPSDENNPVSLETMLESLPPKRRRIISLFIEQGKSHKEIAEEMDISISTVKNQMVKARKHLQTKSKKPHLRKSKKKAVKNVKRTRQP